MAFWCVYDWAIVVHSRAPDELTALIQQTGFQMTALLSLFEFGHPKPRQLRAKAAASLSQRAKHDDASSRFLNESWSWKEGRRFFEFVASLEMAGTAFFATVSNLKRAGRLGCWRQLSTADEFERVWNTGLKEPDPAPVPSSPTTAATAKTIGHQDDDAQHDAEVLALHWFDIAFVT